MKFLHLADLHIGKVVNGFSMLDEQRHAFSQILDYIKSEHISLAVIAGDIYDRSVPGVEAVRLFDEFLTELANENVAVLLISGNHDSPERISYASRLLEDRKLFLRGTFDGSVQKNTFDDDYGEVNFWLLPFVKPSSVRGMFGERDIDEYNEAVIAALDSMDIDFAARNVLVSHQFYTGGGVEPVRSESEMNHVGGLDAVNYSIVEKFDYVALGHLHGAQQAGQAHIRYAGSPLKYSFSEIKQKKSVTLVELSEKGNFTYTLLPLLPIHDMREIKGKLDELTGSEAAPSDDYLRVVLTDEDELVDPMGKLRVVYPNIMSLAFENTRTSIELSDIAPDSETESVSPYDLFHEFFLDMTGSAMTEDQAAIVRHILEAGVEK